MGLLSKIGVNRVRELTAFFPVRLGFEQPLRDALSGTLDHNRLDRIGSMHTARWVILPRLEYEAPAEQGQAPEPVLLFATSFDGKLDTHLVELACVLRTEVESIWRNCVGFRSGCTPGEFRDYVKAHATKSVFFLRDQEEASARFILDSRGVKERFRKLVIDNQNSRRSGQGALESLENFARGEGVWYPVPIIRELERPPKGELREIRLTVGLARRRLLRDYYALRANPAETAIATRGAHAKSHGCLDATFEVNPDLDPEYRKGILENQKNLFDAKIRFSNGSEEIQADKVGDGRGMAIKLYDVGGRRVQDGHVDERRSHDFLLVSSENFFCRDVRTYRIFRAFRDMEGPLGTILAGLFLLARPRQFLNLAKVLFSKTHDLLDTEYHSMTSHLWGSANAVRISARPVEPSGYKRSWWFRRRRPDYLREVLRGRLDESTGEAAVFELAIQVTDDPELVEDPTRQWKSQKRAVLGWIRIQPQTFDTPERERECEHIAFNPWNVHEAHQPLGGMSRVRLAVYHASARLREQLNDGGEGRPS
jgi:hypothetical protein